MVRRLIRILTALVLGFGLPLAHASPQHQLAQQFLESGDQLVETKPVEAIAYYEAALVANPSSVKTYLRLTRAYRNLKLSGAALRAYRKALTVDPLNIEALEGQAMVMLEKNNVAKAKANLKKISKLCQNSCPTVKRLSQAIKVKPRNAKTVALEKRLIQQKKQKQ